MGKRPENNPAVPSVKQAAPPRLVAEVAHRWQNYALLDCGHGEKLERFGPYTLIRPEPQALWPPVCPKTQWAAQAHARFEQEGAQNGKWLKLQPMPDRWKVAYPLGDRNLEMRLALTGFKHVGLFPEQAANWDWIFRKCNAFKKKRPRVLNLFAYTGGASLAARAGGAEVTHVDSIKQIISWARENAEANGYTDVRWAREDALKFVEREARRGNRYNGVLLDPPAFGHGPKGERWKLEDQLDGLLAGVAQIVAPRGFVLVNAYSLGLSPLVLQSMLYAHFPFKAAISAEVGELYFPAELGARLLPTGVFARLTMH